MDNRQKFNVIGSGIYTIPDVARILNLPLNKVARWMRDYWGSELQEMHKHTYYTGVGKDRTTNFNTLIEFYVFYQLRELKISPKKIFEAYNNLAKVKKANFPFATHQLLANPKEIFYLLDDETAVSAKNNQITYTELIRDFCKKIEFSHDVSSSNK